MKKVIVVLYEKMMYCIKQCNLSEKQIEQCSCYLALEADQCNLGIVNYRNLNQDSFSDLKNEVKECLWKSRSLKETERFVHFFDVIFQIFGVSMMYAVNEWVYQVEGDETSQLVALPVSYKWDYIREYVSKTQAIAVLAGVLIHQRNIATDGYWEVLQITSDRNIMAEALKYTNKYHPYADLVILSTMFYEGNGIDTKEKMQETELMKQYPKEFEYYTKVMADSIGSIFIDKLSEQEEQQLKDFIYQDKDGEAVLTDEVKTILSEHEFDKRIGKLLVGFAVLNYRKSPLLLSFLKLCTFGKHMEEVLYAMYDFRYKVAAGREVIQWYHDLHPDTIHFIKWLERKNLNRTASYFAEHYPYDFKKILMESNLYHYFKLFQIVKDRLDVDVQEKYYKEILENSKNIFLEKLIQEIKEKDNTNKNNDDTKLCELVERYLLGECSMEELSIFQEEFDKNNKLWREIGHETIMTQYKKWYGADDFYRRYHGYLVLLKNYRFDLTGYSDEQKFRQQIEEKFTLLVEIGITIEKQFEIAVALYYDKYSWSQKKILPVLASVFHQYLKTYPEETLEVFKKAEKPGLMIVLKAFELSAKKYSKQLLEYIGYPDSEIRKEVVKIFVEHEELEIEMVSLLNSSELYKRQFAVWVIGEYCSALIRKKKENSKYKMCLFQAFEREREKKLKINIAEILRDKCETIPDSKELRYMLNNLKKEKYPQLDWLYEKKLPIIYKTKCMTYDGIMVDEAMYDEYIKYLLMQYRNMKPLGFNEGVHDVVMRCLEPFTVEIYANAIYEKWIKAGARLKDRWVMYFSAIYGGSEIAVSLAHQINEWADNSKNMIAIEAVKALGLSVNPIALLVMDRLSRESKYQYIRKAAKNALFLAAQKAGVSVEEKNGYIAANLGFDKMIMAKWPVHRWIHIFLRNHVMLQYGYSLIWGHYEEGELKQTFRYTLDENFLTIDQKEYILPKHGEIGLIHPAELTEKEVLIWNHRLSDEKLEQSFQQLKRPTFRMTEEEKTTKQSQRFQGMAVNGRKLAQKLIESGWKRGKEIEFGIYEQLYCEDLNHNLACELYFSGSYTGNEEDEDVTIYHIRFYLPKGRPSVRTKWSTDEVINSEEMRAPYFSEIVYQLTKIVEEDKISW